MAELVNLNRVRKERARDQKKVEAAANRVTFGRTKAEREISRAESELAERRLAAHRIAPDEKDT